MFLNALQKFSKQEPPIPITIVTTINEKIIGIKDDTTKKINRKKHEIVGKKLN